jgi:hypothetical protein
MGWRERERERGEREFEIAELSNSVGNKKKINFFTILIIYSHI